MSYSYELKTEEEQQAYLQELNAYLNGRTIESVELGTTLDWVVLHLGTETSENGVVADVLLMIKAGGMPSCDSAAHYSNCALHFKPRDKYVASLVKPVRDPRFVGE